MTLKAVAEKPQDPQPADADPQSVAQDPPSDVPLSIRMPVDIRSAALTILAGLALILVLQYAQAMIIPIVLAVLISYALEPMVAWLVRRRLPRGLAAAPAMRPSARARN